jgi:hypothetical protein
MILREISFLGLANAIIDKFLDLSLAKQREVLDFVRLL